MKFHLRAAWRFPRPVAECSVARFSVIFDPPFAYRRLFISRPLEFLISRALLSRGMRRPEHQQRNSEGDQKERDSDLSWIKDNLHVLWPIAMQQYGKEGRGAIFIDTLTTTAHAAGSGNPMFYVTEQGIELL